MKSKEPLVSVIMNCYNGEKYLKEAIDSVLNQTYQNWEIIFWDNSSNDSSTEIVKSYKDKRIFYYKGDQKVSLGKARNFALQKVTGNYIAFLDVDDLWMPEKLSKQVPFFKDSSIGLIYSLTNTINSNGEITGKYNNGSKNENDTIKLDEIFVNYDVVMSSAVIAKEALLDTAIKFDDLLVYAEEFDLFMRICVRYKAIRVNEFLSLYRIHGKQDSLKLFERSIYEEEYIISKLRLLYPNLFTNPPELLIKKNKKLAWRYFLNYILKKNTVEARKKLLPFVFSSLKYFVLYSLSLFGSKPVKYIWKKYRKKNGKDLFYS